MKILLLDIETAPNSGYFWGLWQENIGINQIIDSSTILCWACKWLHDDEIKFCSSQKIGHKRMLSKIHHLLSEADVVVTYNGARFDIPVLNKEFLVHGFSPPADYRQVDLLKVARNRFKFASNKLDFVAKFLGVGQKTTNTNFDLWVKCMQKDPDSWKIMKEYNQNDVVILEKVYLRMRPWIKNHPNHGLYDKDPTLVCPNCGSKHYQKRGYSYTKSQKYVRFQCQADGCHAWFRSNLAENKRGSSKLIGAA